MAQKSEKRILKTCPTVWFSCWPFIYFKKKWLHLDVFIFDDTPAFLWTFNFGFEVMKQKTVFARQHFFHPHICMKSPFWMCLRRFRVHFLIFNKSFITFINLFWLLQNIVFTKLNSQAVKHKLMVIENSALRFTGALPFSRLPASPIWYLNMALRHRLGPRPHTST